MTDNEIIKAYGCCNLSHDECGGCDNCPCKIEGDCIVPSGFDLEREVFNLLNRQKEQIEALNERIEESENQSQNFKVLVSDHRTLQQSFDNLKGLYEAEKSKVEKAKEKSTHFAKELQTAKAEIERLNNLCQEQNVEVKRLIEVNNELLYNLKAVCEEKEMVGDEE